MLLCQPMHRNKSTRINLNLLRMISQSKISICTYTDSFGICFLLKFSVVEINCIYFQIILKRACIIASLTSSWLLSMLLNVLSMLSHPEKGIGKVLLFASVISLVKSFDFYISWVVESTNIVVYSAVLLPCPPICCRYLL